jgi:hypothetical protein
MRGDQAKRIAKARCGGRPGMIPEARVEKKICVVVPSTGNSPTINSFSTALTSTGVHTTLAA